MREYGLSLTVFSCIGRGNTGSENSHYCRYYSLTLYNGIQKTEEQSVNHVIPYKNLQRNIGQS